MTVETKSILKDSLIYYHKYKHNQKMVSSIQSIILKSINNYERFSYIYVHGKKDSDLDVYNAALIFKRIIL